MKGLVSCICPGTVKSVLTASRGPSCRQPISSSKLFTLEIFNSPEQSTSKKGKRRASGRPFEFATDGADVDESESDSDGDFIVPDDDEDHKPRQGKKKYAKRNVVLSDDEFDDVIIPAAEPKAKPKASAAEMNEDEISTKMQVCIYLPRIVVSCAHSASENDGRAHHIEEVPSRSEGKVRLLYTLLSHRRPSKQTVVISQWTSYLKMVSRYLTNKGFAHVMYQGSMSRDERNRAVRAFMAKDNATVMLMSLKCGGVGLNLTRANRALAASLHAVTY